MVGETEKAMGIVASAMLAVDMLQDYDSWMYATRGCEGFVEF
jgi:hypothetical protein